MGDGSRNHRKWRNALWIAWSLYVGAWTAALLTPHPARAANAIFPEPDLRYVVAKSLHVSAYFVLTVLTGALPVRRPWYYLLLALPSLHGIGTEIGQTFVPDRGGSVMDVGFDHIGIVMGFGILLLWRLCAPNPASPPNSSEPRSRSEKQKEAIK